MLIVPLSYGRGHNNIGIILLNLLGGNTLQYGTEQGLLCLTPVVDVCLSDWRSSTSSDDESPLPPPNGPSELRRGDRALWTCPAVAAVAGRRQPRPGVRWTRVGAVVAAAGRAAIHEDGALEIEDVQSSDAGQYRCSVEIVGGDTEAETQWSDALSLTVLDDSAGKNQ